MKTVLPVAFSGIGILSRGKGEHPLFTCLSTADSGLCDHALSINNPLIFKFFYTVNA